MAMTYIAYMQGHNQALKVIHMQEHLVVYISL